MLGKQSFFFFNSLKYILVSGVSKGFNYILLLYLAIGAFTQDYVIILILISLEQILSLILPLNNPNIIYSKRILKYELITNKLISNSLIILAVYILVFLIFRERFYAYFEISSSLVFISIFINIFINSYLVYLTNYYKIIEEHTKALIIQALLIISFITIVTAIIVLDDKVLAFFAGKAIGLVLVLIIVSLKNYNLSKFHFKTMNIDELKKFFNLLSVSILGWVSGLGFMNIAKLYSTADELLKIGYILNLCNVFLLVSIGINSVYNPIIKKHLINKDVGKALKAQKITLLIYLSIAAICLLIYVILYQTVDFNFNVKIGDVFHVLPYAILIFVFSTFQSVAHPFYLIHDKFKNFNIINIVSYLFWILLILTCSYFGYDNYVWFLVIIYFIKAAFSYFYARLYIMNKNYNIKL